MPSSYSKLESLASSEEIAYRKDYKFITENTDYNSKAYETMLFNVIGRCKK